MTSIIRSFPFVSQRLGSASVPRCWRHDPGEDTTTPNKALLSLLAHGDLTFPRSLTKFDSGSLAIPFCSFHAENKILKKREREKVALETLIKQGQNQTRTS